MCLLLPCCAGATWGSYKIQKSLDKAFSSSSSAAPAEKTENVVFTEAKLAFKLASFKPSSSSGGASTSTTTAPLSQAPPARSTSTKKKVSKKEEESKARLQELINQYAPGRK